MHMFISSSGSGDGPASEFINYELIKLSKNILRYILMSILVISKQIINTIVLSYTKYIDNMSSTGFKSFYHI